MLTGPLHTGLGARCDRLLEHFFILFHQAFWRSAGFSGEVVTNGGMTAVPDCSSGPVSIIYDHRLDNGSPALIGFIAGDVKVEWVQHSVSLCGVRFI